MVGLLLVFTVSIGLAWIGIIYGVSTHPLIEYRFCLLYAMTCTSGATQGLSDAHLLYNWIGLGPVYAQHGKVYSCVLD